MPTKQQEESPKERKGHEREQLNAVIGRKVVNALGQPGNLHRVQVRQLWEDRYRVNIVVGADAASVRVAHSYFLVADSDGNIVTSIPKITREY